MLFNTLEFFLFLAVVFSVYWSLSSLRLQNGFLLLASYFFYGWWDWRFLSLIAVSSAVDYGIGRALGESRRTEFQRRILLAVSLFVNLGILGFFKYYDFFIQSFAALLTSMHVSVNMMSLNILLPVGISFYTFQTLSYTIDVYRREMAPSRSVIDFFAYVSFFPQLVAGPIERARRLLPQFSTLRGFDYAMATDGLRQVLWGFVLKVVMADRCAHYVDIIFARHEILGGSTLLIGAMFFAFQIYGDFAGYSHIAIGVAKLFGFQLMTNFCYPYFSRDIAEFWRRWHISLSTWFRDYLYIPIGGSRGSVLMQLRNVFIVFAVSGLWHGANWTFVAWGVLNACYFIPLMLLQRNRQYLDTVPTNAYHLPSFGDAVRILWTFFLTCCAWIVFRAENMDVALEYYSRLFSSTLFTAPIELPLHVFVIIGGVLIVEWVGRYSDHALQKMLRWPVGLRYISYVGLSCLVIYMWQSTARNFIYFQF